MTPMGLQEMGTEWATLLIVAGALVLTFALSMVLTDRQEHQPPEPANKPDDPPLIGRPNRVDVVLRIDADDAYRLRGAAWRTPDRNAAERPLAAKSRRSKLKPRPQGGARPPQRRQRSPVGRSFDLEYADENGEVTERTIRVVGVRAWQNVVYVAADCSLRRAQRTFRPDRMQRLTDRKTGEEIEDPEGYFLPWCDS